MERFRVWDFLIGCRRGFGDGNQALVLASRAAMRRPANWFLPAGLVAMLLPFVLWQTHWTTNSPGIGFWGWRIIAIDYLVFFFGWIGGWSSAWRWRKNQSFIEELVATNLRPAVAGNLLFAGALGIWAVLLVVLSGWDFVLLHVFPERQDFGSGVSWPFFVFSVFATIPTLMVLVWFHLESLRIAYWMFAVAALPKLNLVNKAIANFVIIPAYVIILTAAGSVVTFITSALAGILISMLYQMLSSHHLVEDPIDIHLAWAWGALPGLVAIGLLKRLICQLYERDFTRQYLLYTWYGAAETQHPMAYPIHMYQQVMPWLLYLREEEKRIAAGEDAPSKPGKGEAAPVLPAEAEEELPAREADPRAET